MSESTSAGGPQGAGASGAKLSRRQMRGEQIPVKASRIVGPGLVAAGTGVGAADLVATLVAGSNYGYALLWAAVLGAVLKVILVEGAGRYSLATGHSIFVGWRSLGKWTSWYFGPYIIIWGVVYAASATTSSALPIITMFDLDAAWITPIAIVIAVAVFGLVWANRYAVIEKIMTFFVLVMFIIVIATAIMTAPEIPKILGGLIPTFTGDGGENVNIVYVLAMAGGVGGTITLAAYGYWLREKGWYAPKWMRVMQLDNTIAYTITGLFVVSVLIIGAELLYTANIALSSGDNALIDLARILGEEYNGFWGNMFLVGFFAAAVSSVIGVWNGVSLMFADFMGHVRKLPEDHPDRLNGGKYFKWYVLWLTFPPMLLLFIGQPTGLVLAYGVLGALFMPFLAITLLGLLNTKRVPWEWRNGWFTNVMLVLCVGLFGYLAVDNLIGLFVG
jgi:Mn2+/Fe2+ NRAMP family transporter